MAMLENQTYGIHSIQNAADQNILINSMAPKVPI